MNLKVFYQHVQCYLILAKLTKFTKSNITSR